MPRMYEEHMGRKRQSKEYSYLSTGKWTVANYSGTPWQGLLLAFVIFTIAVNISGCGYQFRGSESALPPDVRTVYIPRVTNESTEAQVDTLLTEALRDEFERYGVLTVVERASEADATLDATIRSVVQERGATTSNTDIALQMFTVMTVQSELRRRNGALLWKGDNIRVSQSFGAQSGVVVTSSADFASGTMGSSDFSNLSDREVSRGQEQQALEDLTVEVAQRIYSESVIPEF
ncbi:MAG: LPS assembly lipoprotein LptE [Bdellovibrionota bacterium]